MKKKKIFLAHNAGVCYGVKRALMMAENAASASDKSILMFGPLIHNPQAIKALEKKGISVVENLDEVSDNILIIRSHGAGLDIWNKIRQRNIETIDTTCPFVKKAQKLVRKLKDEQYQIIIIGESEHPEVKGLVSFAEGDALVVDSVNKLKDITLSNKIGVVSQTTQSRKNFEQIVCYLREKTKDIKVYDTICGATNKSQEEALKIARDVDVMFVLGGYNSANTTRLAQVCREINPHTYHLETVKELDMNNIRDYEKIGITAGASTPEWIINEFVETIKNYTG